MRTSDKILAYLDKSAGPPGRSPKRPTEDRYGIEDVLDKSAGPKLGPSRDQALDEVQVAPDGPLRHHREDKYHRTALDEVKLGDATTDQIAHYLACRRQMEEHLDEESVFDELCRLAMQADEETNDWFGRITNPGASRDQGSIKEQVRKLVPGETNFPNADRLRRIALGMLSDGWKEHQVRYALGTLVINDASNTRTLTTLGATA